MKEKPIHPLLQVTAYNWRPLVYTAVVISIKYQEDLMIKNKLFHQALGIFSTKEMHYWMNIFSVLLDYKFHVNQSEFNSYYKWLIIYCKLKQ